MVYQSYKQYNQYRADRLRMQRIDNFTLAPGPASIRVPGTQFQQPDYRPEGISARGGVSIGLA